MKKSRLIYPLVTCFVLGITSVCSVHAEDLGSAPPLGPAPVQMEEFGFLIGSWTTTSKRFLPDGTLTAQYEGEAKAQLVDDGRVIFDTFTWFGPDGEKVFFDATLRTFSVKTGRWEMVFMSSLSERRSRSFHGKFVDGEGRFDVVVSLTEKEVVLAKIRFFEIKKDSFEWSMEFSVDNGKNWFIAETITAKRVH